MDSKQSSQLDTAESINILHIEDDALDAQFFQELLKMLPALEVHVNRVCQLKDANDAIARDHYDLILSDLMLSDSRGLSTLEHIHNVAPKTPIIALTSSQDIEISKQAIHYGAEDFLVKGETDIRLLNRAIRYAIDRKQAQLNLEALAQTDALTGLFNRHAFEDRLHQTMLRAQRSRELTALLFVDLDLFKGINDQCGHQAGDKVLQEVAQRLKSTVREQDCVARLGGDEFVVILEDVQSEQIAVSIGQKFLKSLEQPVQLAVGKVHITASIGVHLYGGNNVSTVEDLLSRSDKAMYAAKRKGRNTICCYQPGLQKTQTKPTKESQLDTDLRQALGNNEFFLVYQPLIDIRTGELVGAEALLRWQHPQRGVIFPAEFIELLEITGQIISVGEWVLNTACTQWSDWLHSGKIPTNRKISVNLSPRQIQQPDFAKRLGKILHNTGLSPWLLDLELTEGLLIENSSENIRLMQTLKEPGINLTLDDFGTGFSSLCYLAQFPVDRLKVDKSFVSDILRDRHAEAIAVAIISLANNLGLEVVAEGVDQQEKIDLLCTHGCDLFQGSHFSMPIPAHDFVEQYRQNFSH